MTAGGVATIAVGLLVAWGGIAELADHRRRRRGLERTRATVVGLVDVVRGLSAANTTNRSAVLRFTTRDGREVEAVSSAWSAPGPRIGSAVPVIYDPTDPVATAERAGVRRLKLLLSPLLIAAGAALAGYGTTVL